MGHLLRISAVGELVGAAAFAGLGIYMNRAIGAAPFDHLGPLAFATVIGATIGGLVAPLFRRRGRTTGADVGLTHIALEVTDLDRSVEFYAKYASMAVVHRRPQATDPVLEIAWLSDGTRPFVIVLAEAETVDRPLGPFAHLGVACATREEMDRLCALAESERILREPARDTGGPAGYLAMLSDPDGHTLELSYGQEVRQAVETAAGNRP